MTHNLTSEDLRLFLAVMREGNMLAAARRIGVDHSTVARRLSALEARLNTRLFERSTQGVSPTPIAFTLIAHAERVEEELAAAATSLALRDGEVRGVVRLATPEALGSLLIARNVGHLRTQHPGLTLELVTESRSNSLSKREADLAVMLHPPPRGRLVTRRLADYRLGLYAAPAYLEAHGTPDNSKDLAGHSFVSYIEELAGFPEIVALQQVYPDANVVFRSNSSAAQHEAVAAGCGLGVLHSFAADADHRLVRILREDVHVKRSYWLVMHRDLQKLPRVRAVATFLEDLIRQAQKAF